MSPEMQEIFNSPEFRRLPPAKARYLQEMLRVMDGRSMFEKIQILLSYGFKMKNNGLSFTSAEVSMLMPVLEKNLSPEERARLKQIAGFL